MNGERFRNTAEEWKKYHAFQKYDDYCGPGSIQMFFNASGIEKSQAQIAREVHKKWWGTEQRLILAYLSRFYERLGYKENATLWDLSYHLNRNDMVMVNWWDDLSGSYADGHYSIAAELQPKKHILTLADPSQNRDGVWPMGTQDFKDRWYDSLDVRNKIWIEGWMLWVDPKSKITKKGRK